jgi:flagellar protein FlaJ
MGFYTKISFRMFSQFSEKVSYYFSDLKLNLKRARIKISLQEYVSIAIMTCFIIFLITFPILSFFFGFVFQTFLFSFMSSFSISLVLTIGCFLFFVNYPKFIIKEKAKHIDNALPFAALYLSTIASSKLPIHKIFEIFSKFSKYGELTEEVRFIQNDIDVFGLDVNTALEKAVERSPSKMFKEMVWGMLSTIRSGGDLGIYLKETAVNMVGEYRRKLYEFAHQLTIYIEVYLTAIVLGTIFFTILTSIMSGISESTNAADIVVLQFILIFAFMPMVSAIFILMIKSITPGGE